MKTVIYLFLVVLSTHNAFSQTKKRSLDYIGQRLQSIEPDRTIIYKEIDDRKLELRLFLPDGWKKTDKRPCFHIIHGGGWTGMDPSRMYPFARDLANRHGMVGVAVQYRLHKRGGPTVFDCVKDARSSVRYVRSYAKELGIDPDRIVVSGGSAGGHLAAATALFDEVNEDSDDLSVSCMPNALVLLFPVIDTSEKGYGQKKIGERWKELSPVDHVKPGLPPTITLHGTGDNVTPYAGAKLFHERMLAAGNRSVLVPNDGGAHGYLMRKEDLYNEAITKAGDFLLEIGLLK
ncbi:MAG: alpha/beta hydrolase [Verrucomicrobiales bacterium]|nr:alpha/beta hydrolase [Verrucomicrobiales bacterium]